MLSEFLESLEAGESPSQDYDFIVTGNGVDRSRRLRYREDSHRLPLPTFITYHPHFPPMGYTIDVAELHPEGDNGCYWVQPLPPME